VGLHTLAFDYWYERIEADGFKIARDPTVDKSPLQCAGLNRLEVEDESSLRERSSDPLGLESCAATARDTVKRRQRIGGVGIQLRKDAIRTPTSL
jgi:hypothetical protein